MPPIPHRYALEKILDFLLDTGYTLNVPDVSQTARPSKW